MSGKTLGLEYTLHLFYDSVQRFQTLTERVHDNSSKLFQYLKLRCAAKERGAVEGRGKERERQNTRSERE